MDRGQWTMDHGQKHHRLLGIVGLFKDPYHLLKAAKETQTRNFKHCDAYTPFPIHGLDAILGQKRSALPWVTLVLGLAGCFGGFGLEIFTSAMAWPINVGGKPFNSFPAFVPIGFECTILLGGLATVAAMFMFCRLPNFHAPVLDEKITDNLFALYVPAKEEGFQENDVKALMEKAGAVEVRMIG